MQFKPTRRRSLQTRVTLMVLAAFVVSLWSLTFLGVRMLRQDLQQLVGEQQFSTAEIVAADIDQEVEERLHALKLVAEQITPSHMAKPARVQALFDGSPLLQELFNAGAFVTGLDGVAVASVPQSVGRVGVNYYDRDYIVEVLTTGVPKVSKPVVGKVLNQPVLSMAVPIRDGQGRITGVLAGVTNLSQNNFLDEIIAHRYGRGGGYRLVDPKHRIVVTATDKRFNLEPLPAVGTNPMSDRYADGYRGYGLYVDSKGVEHMSAAHPITVPGWYLLAMLPTNEAFSPIQSVQNRFLTLAGVLTLLASLFTWWILGRELAPVFSAVRRLAKLSQSESFPKALDITRQDEVGQLLTGFNRLLEVLHRREAEVAESERRFRALVEWLPESIAVHDGERLLYANPAAVRMLDASSQAELVGKLLQDIVHPDFRALAATRARASLVSGIELGERQYTLVTLQGRQIEVEVQSIGIEYKGQPASQMVMRDVTQRNTTDRKLRQLSGATEQAPIAIVITDLNGIIEYVNPQFEVVTGFTSAEVLGRNPRILQSGNTPAAVYADLWSCLQGGQAWRGEFHNRKKSGDVFIERAVIAPILDPSGAITHYVALKEDVTVQKRSQSELETSLQEKTALLNEVHHRVKNNLQVIASLLRLESGRAIEPATRAVLVDMQGRIRSMSLVHETLYRSGTFASVQLNDYIRQVATAAFRAQSVTNGGVRLVLNLASVRSSLDQATPCGLLVNELISNSIKHGFPQGASGQVMVELQPLAGMGGGGKRWCLRVSDTGVGLPADFEDRRIHSLGLQLVGDLAGQLGGTLDVGSHGGASFAITFAIVNAGDTRPAR